jgi:hypothetical protein
MFELVEYPIWRHRKTLESVIVKSKEEDQKLHELGYRPTMAEFLIEMPEIPEPEVNQVDGEVKEEAPKVKKSKK